MTDSLPITVIGDHEPSDAAIDALGAWLITVWEEREAKKKRCLTDGATPRPWSDSADAEETQEVPGV